MQRYFTTQTAQLGQTVTLEGEAAHHLQRVMRGQLDDQVEIVTADQQAYQAKVTALQTTTVSLQLQAALPGTEMSRRVLIACGIPKKTKADRIVQKGTELGAAGFIFFASQYGIAKWPPQRQAKKLARLRKIALEAARQAHRNVIPTVNIVANLTALCQQVKDIGIVAYEESGKQGEHTALVQTAQQLRAGQTLLAVFGPEGGLAPAEVLQLRQAAFVPAGLGPRILRAETAPLYLLSALSTLWELC